MFYASHPLQPLDQVAYDLTDSVCGSDGAYLSFTASPAIGLPCFIVGTIRGFVGIVGLVVMFKEDIMF